MCHRLNFFEKELIKLEKEVAFLRGKESTEGVIGHLARENAELKTDLKLCRKVDGDVLLRTHQLANTYMDQPHAIAAHAPVVDVKRVRGDFDDPRDTRNCDRDRG